MQQTLGGVAEPRIDRTLTLHFRGDWGHANLHRVCGWLGSEMCARMGSGSRFAIWNGRGFTDNVYAVADGEVDMALSTPAAFVSAALSGKGVYRDRPLTQLRAIGQVPQNDRLLLAVHPNVGVHSFAELRSERAPLRIATSADDGVSHVGMAAQRYMEAHGIPRQQLESWGGSYVEAEMPFDCLDFVKVGKADAILHEAIMTPPWQELAEAGFVVFDAEPDALAKLANEFDWPQRDLPAGYFPGQTQPLHALDFSDFLLIVRDDMADDLAYLMAWCLSETRAGLERQYRHLKPERSPVTWPLEPPAMARTPIPLHPGAERFYRDHGYL